MRADEVIEKIDELRSLFTKIQEILEDYDGIISVYSENNLEFSYEDCDYWKNQLDDAKQNIMNYWRSSDNNYDGEDTELDESVEENSSSAQEIRDIIYSMLMTHSDYFRNDFGSQFDSDDDIECEINDIVKRVKKGQPIEYVIEVSPVFDEKLTEMVRKYIDLTSK